MDDRLERWYLAVMFCIGWASWYWDWDSFIPRWVWAFVVVGYVMLQIGRIVDRQQKELTQLKDRVWQLESKNADRGNF